MATSDPRGPFVWVFLPGRSEPVVAGVLARSSTADGMAFRYGNSYLRRDDAMSLGPDLPLSERTYPPALGHKMPSTIRDAMPDSWGRHVINRELGLDLEDSVPDAHYMLESGSDRVGALDFQASATEYVPRVGGGALTEIADTAVAVDDDQPRGVDLGSAIRNTLTAAGGSQPKAYVRLDGREWLAKFQTEYDRTSPLIKAERAALYVAEKAGLDVPAAKLVHVNGRGLALLTERFDRQAIAAPADDAPRQFSRRQVLSGFTVGEDHRAVGASYPDLVARLRVLSVDVADAGTELFRRLAFRIAMRIDDDHMRNLAFFWDGQHASFTPAFDLSPDLTASTPHGLTDLGGGSREFTLSALEQRRDYYHLSATEARDIIEHTLDAVITHRSDAADVAQMVDWERQALLTATASPLLIG